ncbi:MAG: hypothetical protein P8Y03_30265, partial [Anaerolineales bacterium]
MRNLLLILSLLVFTACIGLTPAAPLTGLPTRSAPTTAPASPSPATPLPYLNYLAMQDAKTGWALGEKAVLRTTDGGGRWQEVSPDEMPEPQYGLQGFFMDAATAWLLVSASSGSNSGMLYCTSDAGDTWQATQVPFAGGDLQFMDAQNGWVMADRGVAAGPQAVDIYHTADGGQTRALVSSAGPDHPQSQDQLPFAGNKS